MHLGIQRSAVHARTGGLGLQVFVLATPIQGVALLSNASTKRPRALHGAMCLLMVLEEKCSSVTLLLFLPLMLSAVDFVAHHLSYR